MQTQILDPWSPIAEASGEWQFGAVSDTASGLIVSLDRGTNSGDTLLLEFGHVPAYRVSPSRIYNYSPEGGSLRIASNSDYLAWLREASGGVHDQPYRHFVILTVDGTVEVLSPGEPRVKVQKSAA